MTMGRRILRNQHPTSCLQWPARYSLAVDVLRFRGMCFARRSTQLALSKEKRRARHARSYLKRKRACAINTRYPRAFASSIALMSIALASFLPASTSPNINCGNVKRWQQSRLPRSSVKPAIPFLRPSHAFRSEHRRVRRSALRSRLQWPRARLVMRRSATTSSFERLQTRNNELGHRLGGGGRAGALGNPDGEWRNRSRWLAVSDLATARVVVFADTGR